MHDLTQLLQSGLIMYIVSFKPIEFFLLGDKGYQGAPRFFTPFKGIFKSHIHIQQGKYLNALEEAQNLVLASVRQLVENVLHRVKIFGVLGSRGRFHSHISKHKCIFNICCQLTNISMEREPCWSHINPYLMLDELQV